MTPDDEPKRPSTAETGVALYRPTPRRLPLFAWGRLQDRKFVGHLLGHPVDATPATLRDVAAVDLDGSGEPLLVASPGSQVDGWLICGLMPSDYERIDAYSGVEEGLYRRLVGSAADESEEERDVYFYLASEKALDQFT